ncbi:MAG: autotransporter domain-containing protein [Fusobacterium sp.]|uniref:autotransporter outer membrane beta-barrel domain-containing protein n=1 Tax=Fusobacterium sp. TaxID=68766 RepID=UPI00399A39A0
MFKREKLKQQVSVLFLALSFFSYTEEKPIYNDKDVKERITVKEGEIFYNNGVIKNNDSPGVQALKNSTVYNNKTISNKGDYGIEGEGALNITNNLRGVISNGGSVGIGLYNGNTIKNSGMIMNKGSYGIEGDNVVSVTNEDSGFINNYNGYGIKIVNGQNITNKGVIENKGNYGIYADHVNEVLNNEGAIIKNTGEYGIYLENSKITNKGIVSNGNNYGVYVKNSNFENSTSGIIENKGNYGVVIEGKSYGVNYGTIANEGDYGVQVENSGTFVNHGTISQKGETAILLGEGDNILELGTDSKIKGVIEGSRGTDTLILSETSTSSETAKIDYKIKNFSNIAVQSGEWTLDTDLLLSVPDKYKDKNTTFSQPPLPINDMSGTFKIEKNRNLVMNIEISDLLTPTISTRTLINEGTIIKRPIDSMYVTNDKKILVPTIYIKDAKNSNIGDIRIENVAEGWEGKYNFDQDKGIVYLVLSKLDESILGKNIVGGFYESIYSYPKSNVHQLNNLKTREKNYNFSRESSINKVYPKNNFQLIGSHGKYYGSSWHPAYSYNSYGVNGQSSFSINDKLVLGLNYDYIGSRVDYKDMANSKENIDSFTLAGSISYLNNNWLNTLQMGTGYSRHDLKRYILDREDNFNKREIKGDYGSYLYSIGWETGYILGTNRKYLYPFVGVDYVWNKDNSYREKQLINSDEDDYSLNVRKSIESSAIFKAGLKFNYSFTEKFHINGDLQWQHREKNYKDNEANFIFKPDVHYTIPTLKTSKDIQSLNLTTTYKTDSLTEYSLALDSVINKKYIDTSVSIGVKYRF